MAQCGAVLNGKVRTFIVNAIASGVVNSTDAQAIINAAGSSDASSVQNINALSPALQTLIRDAFRDGSRWCFISLLPWAGVAFITSLFLSTIKVEAPQEKESTPVTYTQDGNKDTESGKLQ